MKTCTICRRPLGFHKSKFCSPECYREFYYVKRKEGDIKIIQTTRGYKIYFFCGDCGKGKTGYFENNCFYSMYDWGFDWLCVKCFEKVIN